MKTKHCRLLIMVAVAAIILAGCATSPSIKTAPITTTNTASISTSSIGNAKLTASGTTTSQQTSSDFVGILKLVPVSFLNLYDIRYGDQGTAKQLGGFSQVNSLDAYMKLTSDQRQQLSKAMEGVTGLQAINNWTTIAPLVGFDYWMIDRTIYDNSVPPSNFSILQGSFDTNLIEGKLVEQGYKKVEYGGYAYYSAGADMQINPSSPIQQQVLSAANQIAVLDRTIVTAPKAAVITGVFDALSGKQPNLANDPATQALAASLGDILAGVIITPDRIMNPGFAGAPAHFSFAVPADWGILHPYDMVGMGYSSNGTDRYWNISLYYKDLQSAREDASILVRRLNSYQFNTELDQGSAQSSRVAPLTDLFNVGAAEIRQFGQGATVTVQCKLKPDTGGNYWQIPILELRDLLFLAPDPLPYVTGAGTTPPPVPQTGTPATIPPPPPPPPSP